MADREAVKALVRGAYDMHVHSGPDVLPRRFDDVALAEHALEVGLKGFVLKSHYVGTADRASLLRRVYPGLEAHGGLVLNNSVGGLNPLAVDIAGRLGTRVVWLPTVDAANELSNIAGQQDESKLPYWMTVARELRDRGIAGEGLRVTDDDGAVTGPAMQCLELIAHYDMVLATGHVSPAEMLAVVRAAREVKVQRIVVTHPEFPSTFLSLDQQRELARYGVFFERCFTQPYTKKVEWETVYDNIRRIGPGTTILSTDLGQSTAPWVGEGLGIFYGNLLDAGFTQAQVETMAHHNPAQALLLHAGPQTSA